MSHEADCLISVLLVSTSTFSDVVTINLTWEKKEWPLTVGETVLTITTVLFAGAVAVLAVKLRKKA